jgi:hypothetical protein
MFRIGQPVVCVDATPCMIRDITPDLKEGDQYTISGLSGYKDACGEYGVTVHGARAQVATGYFRASRFRPVVEKKTDISWAEEILRRESIDTPERVS